MNLTVNTRAKSQLPATYEQSQFLINSENVDLVNIAIPAANARITKCMDRWEAAEAIDAAIKGEQVTIQFN